MPTGPAYRYAATVLSVHDGDTFTADVDVGFSVRIRTPLRLRGCNAIELGQPGGQQARDHLASLLVGQVVTVSTVRPDKFGGRYDAAVSLPDGTDLVARLVAEGWAAAWNGRGPRPVPPWPRPGV
jgi:endonuclease YncB( thermonuclease family)